MSAEEGARDDPGGGFAAQPGLRHREQLRRRSGCAQRQPVGRGRRLPLALPVARPPVGRSSVGHRGVVEGGGARPACAGFAFRLAGAGLGEVARGRDPAWGRGVRSMVVGLVWDRVSRLAVHAALAAKSC